MKKAVEVHIPSVPNFIMVGDDKKAVSTQNFTEDELREIGKEWTEKLVKHAKAKRL